MVKGEPGRRWSNGEQVANSAALQDILAVSETLTYKQVRRIFAWEFPVAQVCLIVPENQIPLIFQGYF
jgi:hypothetical protein